MARRSLSRLGLPCKVSDGTNQTRRKDFIPFTFVFSSPLAVRNLALTFQTAFLQCYFLNFGNADIPILYTVQRLRDGRSYSTRTVLATQQGTPIFTLTCSFCLPEPSQPVRSLPLPRWPLVLKEGMTEGKIPEPEECEATEDVLTKALSMAKNLPKKLQE